MVAAANRRNRPHHGRTRLMSFEGFSGGPGFGGFGG
ncbi:MAG: hypothetical protein QOH20_101, partial [Mycobacterium sp.]|nr:hypothetical protein [Mycobacterium sp.]